MKLVDLAAQYHMTLDDAIQKLEEHGIFILAVNADLNEEKTNKYERILAGNRTTRPMPHPTPKPASMPRPTPVDKERRQKEMLSRDFVFFTHMALRKPVTGEILRQAVEYKLTDHTRTKIVICSSTIKEIQETAKDVAKLESTAKALDLLEQYQMLTILPGSISAENQLISDFLKEKVNLGQSVLIVGYNRALSTYVRFRNKINKNDSRYKLIYEKDVSPQGFLVNHENERIKAFQEPEGKPTAPYGTDEISLSGGIPQTGESVFIKQKDRDGNISMTPILLESEINRGAEGAIYKV